MRIRATPASLRSGPVPEVLWGNAPTRGVGGVPGRSRQPCSAAFAQLMMEPMTGIEPAYSAWEADVLPLNYIGAAA